MAVKQFLVPQATKAFVLTPSDTVNIIGDVGNTEDVAFVYPHSTSASGTARVLLAGMADGDTPVTVYLIQGQVMPFAIKRLYATAPVPPTVIGMY